MHSLLSVVVVLFRDDMQMTSSVHQLKQNNISRTDKENRSLLFPTFVKSQLM